MYLRKHSRGYASTISASAVLIVSLWTICSCTNAANTITIINRDAVNIVDGSVSVCGNRVKFGRIDKDRAVKVSFSGKCLSDFNIRLRFIDGRTGSYKIGYLTSGVSTRETVEMFGGQLRYVDRRDTPTGL